MRTPNTTFDIYLGGALPPAAPDVEGATGHLSDHFAKGQESTEGATRPVWTSILEVPLGTNLPDGYRGGEASATTWFPDKNGIGYTVVFTERERGFRGKDFLRVYLVKGAIIVALAVQEADGTPSYSSITTLLVDQADGLSLSQPAANQARLDLLTQMSLTADASGLKLNGDTATPGNDQYYGTNGSGTRGWYDLPSGGGGGGDDPGLARGWVKFSAAGGLTILDSHNVDSVTDNGIGDWTVNWDTDFANSDYCWSLAFENSGDAFDVWHIASNGNQAESATDLDIRAYDSFLDPADATRICVAAWGDQ